MHGMLKSMVAGSAQKRLGIERIRAIKVETRIFMTLHGASATADEDLREAIQAGMTVVHINTEVRLAWRRGWDEALAKYPDEIVPYKILPQVSDRIKRVVANRMQLFSEGLRAVPRRYNATPTVARYDTQLGEFIVMYDDVLSSVSPSAAVLDFCHSTYGSGATL